MTKRFSILLLFVGLTILSIPLSTAAFAKTAEECRAESYQKYPAGTRSRSDRERAIQACASSGAIGTVKEKSSSAKGNSLAPRDEGAWMERCLKSPTGGSEARCTRALNMRKRGIDPTVTGAAKTCPNSSFDACVKARQKNPDAYKWCLRRCT